MKDGRLSWLLPLIATLASSASAQIAPETGPWGEAADGLQLNLTASANIRALLESRTMLFFNVTLRKVSDKPAYVAMTSGDVAYNYEYEFDGTWYAFDPVPPLRTTRNLLQVAAPVGQADTQSATSSERPACA